MTTAEAKTIAENVKNERNKLGWSQEALALEAGVSRNTITNIEKMHTEISLNSLDKVAKALGKTVEQLRGQDSIDAFLSEEEMLLLNIYRSIPDNKKNDSINIIQLFANACV